MKAVFKRELRALFTGWSGWGFLALTTGAAALSVFFVNILSGTPSFAQNSVYLALAMALGCGLCCMRAFPGECASGTERLLYMLPLKNCDIVLGKLFSRLVLVALSGVLMAVYPLGLSLAFEQVSLGEGLSCVLAVTLMGALFMSAALFCSACSRSSITAFVSFAALTCLSWAAPYAADKVAVMTSISPLMIILGTALVALVVYALISDWLIAFICAALQEMPVLLASLRGEDAEVFGVLSKRLNSLSVFEPLTAFVNGILDAGTLIEYVLLAAFFAALCGLAVAARRRCERRAL